MSGKRVNERRENRGEGKSTGCPLPHATLALGQVRSDEGGTGFKIELRRRRGKCIDDKNGGTDDDRGTPVDCLVMHDFIDGWMGRWTGE
jgi:hypothetical protein